MRPDMNNSNDQKSQDHKECKPSLQFEHSQRVDEHSKFSFNQKFGVFDVYV